MGRDLGTPASSHGPMVSAWASCQRWMCLWMDKVSLSPTCETSEHGRHQDPNPVVLRGLEASEGASCSDDLPNSRSGVGFQKPGRSLRSLMSQEPKSMG